MSEPPRPEDEPAAERPTLGVEIDASAPLGSVLAWGGLPGPLRRALTRAVPPEALERVTLGESLRAWRDPVYREWVTALISYDAGVSLAGGAEPAETMIGLLASGQLDGAEVSRVFLAGVTGGQGFGAAFRAPSPSAPATVCCAAFVYRDAKGALESDFVFVAGATAEPVVQLELRWVAGRALDERHVEHALGSVAEQVDPAHAESARGVVREALRECLAVLDRS